MADLNKLSASDMQVLAEAFENISNEFKRISNVFKTNDQLEFDIDKIDDHEEENVSAFDEKSISSIDNKDTKTNKDCAEYVKEPDITKKPDNFSKSDIGMSELKNDLIYGMNENSWDPKAKDISSEKVVVDESSSEQSGEKSTDESAVSDSKSLKYGVYLSTTDSVLRILDTNDNSIYLKIYGNKASEDSVASIEDMVETIYPNVYINTNTNEIGIIISESGMYILKPAENISNELIQTIADWAGLSSDTEKSIIDTDIQPELTSVMDESVVSAAKEQLNNNTDSENTKEQ